jgi:hypothetical protein
VTDVVMVYSMCSWNFYCSYNCLLRNYLHSSYSDSLDPLTSRSELILGHLTVLVVSFTGAGANGGFSVG